VVGAVRRPPATPESYEELVGLDLEDATRLLLEQGRLPDDPVALVRTVLAEAGRLGGRPDQP
jgi:hypothetical protein